MNPQIDQPIDGSVKQQLSIRFEAIVVALVLGLIVGLLAVGFEDRRLGLESLGNPFAIDPYRHPLALQPLGRFGFACFGTGNRPNSQAARQRSSARTCGSDQRHAE